MKSLCSDHTIQKAVSALLKSQTQLFIRRGPSTKAKWYDCAMFPEEAFKLSPLNVAPIVVKTIHDLLELPPVIVRALYLHECDCNILPIHQGASCRRPSYLLNLIFFFNNVMGNVLHDWILLRYKLYEIVLFKRTLLQNNLCNSAS